MNEQLLRSILKALENINTDAQPDKKMSITIVGKPNKEMMAKEGTPIEEMESMENWNEDDFPMLPPDVFEKMKKMTKKGC